MGCSEPLRPRLPKGPPELPPDTELLEYLLSLEPEAREEMVRNLGIAYADAFDRDWPTWAHEGQEPPEKCADGSDWSTCVVMGGRGFGKTLSGSKWITARIAAGEKLSIALVGATLAEARRVMVEGRSGLLEVAGPWIREWRPSLGTLKFRTGAEATLFSGHSPEILRGPEHHIAWCDELAKWEKPQETWDMLLLGLRLGDWPRAIVTTTPRPGPVLRSIMAEPGCVMAGGPSSANPHNAPSWHSAMQAKYAGTRLARQELEGELLTDHAGALWTVELLERSRQSGTLPRAGGNYSPPLDGEGSGVGWTMRPAGALQETPPPPNPPPSRGRALEGSFTRIVIGVDPPAGDGTCGIVACAKDQAGIAHVLADHSVTARSPEGWARAVADAARIWSSPSFPCVGRGPDGSEDWAPASAGAQPAAAQRPPIWVMCPKTGDYVLKPPNPPQACLGEGDHAQHGGGVSSSVPVQVVAEKNQGGAMVAAILRTADPALKVKPVTAKVGKSERAEPVAHLFEAGKVVLHGRFPELEAQLLGMIAGGEYEGPGTSPDRADAMVWALTELMLGVERAPPSIRRL